MMRSVIVLLNEYEWMNGSYYFYEVCVSNIRADQMRLCTECNYFP